MATPTMCEKCGWIGDGEQCDVEADAYIDSYLCPVCKHEPLRHLAAEELLAIANRWRDEAMHNRNMAEAFARTDDVGLHLAQIDQQYVEVRQVLEDTADRELADDGPALEALRRFQAAAEDLLRYKRAQVEVKRLRLNRKAQVERLYVPAPRLGQAAGSMV